MPENVGPVLESLGTSVASKTTVVGGLTGAFGWLAQINWVGLIGVAVAIVGLLFNIYFQVRRDRREAAESAARINALHLRQGPPPTEDDGHG